MGVGFELVNITKGEVVSFAHLPVNTINEIVRNPVSSSIVTWYLSENQGDEIQFVSDTYKDWPFSFGVKEDIAKFEDVTDLAIDKLIKLGVIRDLGFEFQDEDEPDTVYVRALAHCDVQAKK